MIPKNVPTLLSEENLFIKKNNESIEEAFDKQKNRRDYYLFDRLSLFHRTTKSFSKLGPYLGSCQANLLLSKTAVPPSEVGMTLENGVIQMCRGTIWKMVQTQF